MDEKLSYKEFLDRNDTWAMDDRELCFEPVFKPMEMAGMPVVLCSCSCSTLLSAEGTRVLSQTFFLILTKDKATKDLPTRS